jgi:hypothetical protein
MAEISDLGADLAALIEAARSRMRAAQLWMLDRGRVAPAEMPEELARQASGQRPADIVAWAGITHQGR